MARQLRHNVEGGWHPVTTRGMGRREVFLEDRERLKTDKGLQRTLARVRRELAGGKGN